METDSPSEVISQTEEDMARKKFGTRFLTDAQNVFQHNAWDNAVWDEEQEAAALKVATEHAQHAVTADKKNELEKEAVKHWDQFYGVHSNRFFKDRHWLFTEFPELHGDDKDKFTDPQDPESVQGTDVDDVSPQHADSISDPPRDNTSCTDQHESLQQQIGDLCISHNSGSSFSLLEVGCGVGNTVFPILRTNKSTDLKVYCCDFSPVAIDIVKSHPDYEARRCHAFVYDITAEKADIPFDLGSLDIIIMIFVLSALSPEKMQSAVNRLSSYLKPGGTLLFRDYGRYDLAQLRFKKGRCLSENFYVRGDGTRVYFFTQEELKVMFGQAGLVEKENIIDRRLQVNRGRQLKMYRVWIQCKYVKPLQ